MVVYYTTFCAGFMQTKVKSLTRVRSNSRYTQPNKTLSQQLSQTRLWPSGLPWCSQAVHNRSDFSLIYPHDALLYSKEKMLILYLFFRSSKKGQTSLSLYLLHLLLAHAVQQSRATWSRCLSVICSLSIPHGSSNFFNRKNSS